MKDLENDEFVKVIINDNIHDDSLDLNKARHRTLDNDIENDDYVVAIQPLNDANMEHLLEKSSLNE